MDDIRNELAACCKKLRLSASLADRAMTLEGATNQEYLLNLLLEEITSRNAARITRNLNSAGFPCRYTPEQYRTSEIDFPDGVSFESLLALDFYHGGKNVIMYGGTGTGKTMLSILIGMEACRQDVPSRFFRTAALVNQLAEHKQAGRLSRFKKKKLDYFQLFLILSLFLFF